MIFKECKFSNCVTWQQNLNQSLNDPYIACHWYPIHTNRKRRETLFLEQFSKFVDVFKAAQYYDVNIRAQWGRNDYLSYPISGLYKSFFFYNFHRFVYSCLSTLPARANTNWLSTPNFNPPAALCLQLLSCSIPQYLAFRTQEILQHIDWNSTFSSCNPRHTSQYLESIFS